MAKWLAPVLLAGFLAVPAGAATKLSITVWPEGLDAGSKHYTLTCSPSGGTLPRPGFACRKLLALPAPFAPTPPNVMCTQIYGGPNVARVTGVLRGRKVWATFRRRNGCEIQRWERVGFLFP